jgi:hypothetical protein
MNTVKCPVCGLYFDKTTTKHIHMGNRYYHLCCCGEDQIYKHKIFKLLEELWGKYTYLKINNQIIKFNKEFNYSIKEIYEDLYFFFVIEKSDSGRYTDTIGIVPYIHTRARKYFLEIEKKEVKKENITKKLNQIESNEERVVLIKPQNNKKKQLFDLEIEEE